MNIVRSPQRNRLSVMISDPWGTHSRAIRVGLSQVGRVSHCSRGKNVRNKKKSREEMLGQQLPFHVPLCQSAVCGRVKEQRSEFEPGKKWGLGGRF